MKEVGDGEIVLEGANDEDDCGEQNCSEDRNPGAASGFTQTF